NRSAALSRLALVREASARKGRERGRGTLQAESFTLAEDAGVGLLRGGSLVLCFSSLLGRGHLGNHLALERDPVFERNVHAPIDQRLRGLERIRGALDIYARYLLA